MPQILLSLLALFGCRDIHAEVTTCRHNPFAAEATIWSNVDSRVVIELESLERGERRRVVRRVEAGVGTTLVVQGLRPGEAYRARIVASDRDRSWSTAPRVVTLKPMEHGDPAPGPSLVLAHVAATR